jgi:hypothetical protein
MRFEVIVTTPHLKIVGPGTHRLATSIQRTGYRTLLPKFLWKTSSLLCPADVPVELLGSLQLTAHPLSPRSQESVTWIHLFDDIHDLQQHIHPPRTLSELYGPYREGFSERMQVTSLVCFTRSSRSWDFMPPDIVRPVASTTIGDLVSLVHRMRLTWIDFKPDEGMIRATGNGRSVSASRVRGLGLVVEYHSNGTRLTEQLSMLTPSSEADRVREKNVREHLSSFLLRLDGMRNIARHLPREHHSRLAFTGSTIERLETFHHVSTTHSSQYFES